MAGVPLASTLAVRSPAYQENLAQMQALWDEVAAQLDQVPTIGGQKYVDRHRRRGKMLPRERINMLVDPASPFLEVAALAGYGTQDPPGVGLVTGIGVVQGVECMIWGSDMTYRGGTINPTTGLRIDRALEIARLNRLPVIVLIESGGGDLPRQSEYFVRAGGQFKELTRLSKAGIPTITAAFGPNTAGGAYVPGMSDYTIFVKERGLAYLGGPPLVEMAIGETVDEESLGGAEMHARTSGLADFLAADEMDALRQIRSTVAHLGWRKLGPGPTQPADPPAHDPGDLLGCASADVRIPFEIREIVARVVDGSRFEEFKPLYGDKLVCGWASIHGYPVGILGNNGILFSEEAAKGSQFIQLCNRTHTPLIFLHNITGFMVGSKAEQGGIIRNGAKLINAVSNSTVPHLVLMVGASYGAGNYGMAGRAYDPRFVFTWPNHRIAVMGPKQLGGVMDIVARSSAARQGIEITEEWEAAHIERVSGLEIGVERESTALYATGHLWDDGIIHPADSRTVLGLALSAVHSNVVEGANQYGVWRH